MIGVWLIENVASGNNRAVEKIWKLLPGIRLLRAVKQAKWTIMGRTQALSAAYIVCKEERTWLFLS